MNLAFLTDLLFLFLSARGLWSYIDANVWYESRHDEANKEYLASMIVPPPPPPPRPGTPGVILPDEVKAKLVGAYNPVLSATILHELAPLPKNFDQLGIWMTQVGGPCGTQIVIDVINQAGWTRIVTSGFAVVDSKAIKRDDEDWL